MKKSLLLFFVSLLINQVLYAQTNKATYSYKIEHPEIEYVESYETVNQLALNNELYVFFNNNESVYTSQNVMEGRINMVDGFTGALAQITYQKDNKSVTANYSNPMTNENFCAKHDVSPVWTITEETKNIDGYECIKAIGKMEHLTDPTRHTTIEAWFAPSLPYSFGPKYGIGLPGLVVYMVQSNRHKFKLEKIEFNIDDDIIEKLKCKGNFIGREKYAEIIKRDIGK